MKKKKLVIKIVELFILINVAVILTVLTGKVSKIGQAVNFLGLILTPTQYAGVLTAIRLIIYVAIVLIERRFGLLISILLILYGSVGMTVNTIRYQLYDSVPGVASMIAGIILCIIISSFLKHEDRHKQIISDMSNRDMLTGLYNRRALMSEIENYISKKKTFNLTSILVENISEIASEHGLSFADEFMAEFGDRIVHSCGDMFSASLSNSNVLFVTEDESRITLCDRFDRIYAELCRPVMVGDEFVVPKIIMKSVSYPSDGGDSATLLRHMDSIPTKSEEDGVHRLLFMEDIKASQQSEILAIEDRIIEALKNEELKLVFQPQYVGKTKKLRGFETLSRMNDKNGNPVRPDIFIKIAERSNLVYEVDRYVLDHAMRYFKPVVKLNPEIVISVNISAKHFAVEGFADEVIELLRKNAFPAWQLEVEVTETAFTDHLDKVRENIVKLRELSVKVALDDFGTGYASLSFLSELPVDTLKIDKSFVDKIGQSEKDDDFVVVILSIAKILNLETVAEGVEKEEQLEVLKSWGCDFIQGFVWGKPMPFDDASNVVENK